MTIYQLPYCANEEFWHWFYLALATLYRVADCSGAVYFTVPMQGLEFQKSSLKYLEHSFINTNEINDTVVQLGHIHLDENNHPIEKEIYPFLRKVFYEKNKFPDIKPLSRLIYISRAKNETYKNRHVLNESDFIPRFIEMGYEIIYLETLCFDEKVKVFLEARIIVTPIGGALALGFFMNKEAKVIEINAQYMFRNHFKCVYTELGIPFIEYNDVQGVNRYGENTSIMDELGNMRIKDVDHFIKFIESNMTPNQKSE